MTSQNLLSTCTLFMNHRRLSHNRALGYFRTRDEKNYLVCQLNNAKDLVQSTSCKLRSLKKRKKSFCYEINKKE